MDELCYSTHYVGTRLAYKIQGTALGSLIYKWAESGYILVQVAWSDGRDLDVCAYWGDDPSNKFGYSYSGVEQSANHTTKWSGDVTAETGVEWFKIKTTPMAAGQFIIHLNWFGEVGSNCTVTVLDLQNNRVSANYSPASNLQEPATTSDPCATLTITAAGVVTLS